MRDFLYAIESSNVIKRINAWREASVEAEDLVIDQRGKRKVVEEVGEVFPYVRVTVFT